MNQPVRTRRSILKGLAGLPAATGVMATLSSRSAIAQPAPVKVALITPLSGIWAREGELSRKGAQMAIEDVNAQGGIRSMGGAPMHVMVPKRQRPLRNGWFPRSLIS